MGYCCDVSADGGVCCCDAELAAYEKGRQEERAAMVADLRGLSKAFEKLGNRDDVYVSKILKWRATMLEQHGPVIPQGEELRITGGD